MPHNTPPHNSPRNIRPEKKLLIALAGNPNSGKTTLFNALTGARQHVGNYPGITVEKKEGFAHICGERSGAISWTCPARIRSRPTTQEELVARNVLVDERPPRGHRRAATPGALERNLYLAVQIHGAGRAHGAGAQHDWTRPSARA